MREYLFFSVCILLPFIVAAQETNLVNAPYDEQNAVISPDGNYLYFTFANHPQNIDGAKDPGDIWVSRKLSNGSWGAPRNAGDTLNSRGWNGVLGFNDAGTMMFLHHHYADNGRPRTQGISYSRKTGIHWGKPENIAIPYFKNESSHQSGWVSEDSEIILLSFEGYNTQGAEDIYLITKSGDGSWGTPINLGQTINTRFQEFTPYYSPSDSLLYFSSNGRGGMGSSDIFQSKRLDDTWRSWSEPVALGDTINSNGKDIGFKNFPDQNFSIYATSQNSDGYGDIRIHRYGLAPEEAGETSKLFVVNSRTDQFIPAEVSITDENGQANTLRILASGTDISSFAPGAYELIISSPGFLTEQEQLVIKEGATQQYTVVLQPLDKGTRMVLENVLFEQSKAKLLPQSYDQLDMVVQLMKENPELKIRLEGHTDPRGSAKANLKLSKMRVDAVKDYLVNKGISKRRIDGKGYGGEQPLYPNDTDENRMKNRRVEFVIVD